VSPDFWGCNVVPGDPGHRTVALRWRDRESVQRTPWWRGADIRKSTLARVLFSMHPCPIAEKPNVELLALWSIGRSVELVRNAGVGPGSDPGAGWGPARRGLKAKGK
jgi:hypothetical protein